MDLDKTIEYLAEWSSAVKVIYSFGPGFLFLIFWFGDAFKNMNEKFVIILPLIIGISYLLSNIYRLYSLGLAKIIMRGFLEERHGEKEIGTKKTNITNDFHYITEFGSVLFSFSMVLAIFISRVYFEIPKSGIILWATIFPFLNFIRMFFNVASKRAKVILLIFFWIISLIGGMAFQNLLQETAVNRITDPIRKTDFYKKINPLPVPKAVIRSPPNDSTFSINDKIILYGEAIAGTFPYNYKWTSNVSGQITTSPYFESTSLPSGSHLITFTIYDDNDLKDDAKIALFIEPLISSLKIEPLLFPLELPNGNHLIRIDVTNNGTQVLENIAIDYNMPTHMNKTIRTSLNTATLRPNDRGYFEFEVEGLNTSCNFADKISIKFYKDKQGRRYVRSIHPFTKVCMFTTLNINISAGKYYLPFTYMYPFSEGTLTFEAQPSEIDPSALPYDKAQNKSELEYLPNRDISITAYDFSTPCLRGEAEMDWCRKMGYL